MSLVQSFVRALTFRLPLMRGDDVLALQRRLTQIGAFRGSLDGLFGEDVDEAVRGFQRAKGLAVDGIVGPRTWSALFDGAAGSGADNRLLAVVAELTTAHRFLDSVPWMLGPRGLSIDGGSPEGSGGEPKTVRRVWNAYGPVAAESAEAMGVPVELIVATICTESGGDAASVREEPGYVSDGATPNKVSPGVMQTLISTARAALADPTIDRAWLLDPANSIRAGTAYIASQWKTTHLDPPKVACAYNAGGVYHNPSPGNRWKMRQYPINSPHHADRFVKWFNDCFLLFEREQVTPAASFFRVLR